MHHLPFLPAWLSLKHLLTHRLRAVTLVALCALAYPIPASTTAFHLIPSRRTDVFVSYFVHTSTTANTAANWTDLDNYATNNFPNAMVMVTANWDPNGEGGVYDPHPLGVWYNGITQKWSIFHEDGSPMPIGASFNVRALSGAEFDMFLQRATPANSTGNWTDISSDMTDNQPNAVVLVTPNWNPGQIGGIYDPHPLGVWYHSGHWAIFHQDLTPIPNGASYNIWVRNYYSGVQTATGDNSAGDFTCIPSFGYRNDPTVQVWVTANWNPGGMRGVYDSAVLGVFYRIGTDQWCIFHEDESAVPLGASYNFSQFG
jgi:hypothetical protein